MSEWVVLVDEQDRELGVAEKLQVHIDGSLHRAFSVFVFNGRGELLIQKRAAGKYHSPGLWTNTCCSHPRPGEAVKTAANRRLQEEMGMECELVPAFSFVYKAEMENSLTEHEFDHVFTGISDKFPVPNPAEVSDYRYITIENLQKELDQHPENFTAWLKICWPLLLKHRSAK